MLGNESAQMNRGVSKSFSVCAEVASNALRAATWEGQRASRMADNRLFEGACVEVALGMRFNARRHIGQRLE